MVASATASTYDIPATNLTMSGDQYRVVVTGSAGSVISSAASLTVTHVPGTPEITSNPVDLSLFVGASASFSVTATGTSLTYQWQSSPDGAVWTNVSGATNATLTLAAVTLADSGKRFRAVVGNGGGSVPSKSALLTAALAPQAPQVITQPVPVNVVSPQTATFSVVATGNPAPTFQWQLSIDGTNYTDIALTTGASYTTPATATTDSGHLFRVNVSNAVGSVLSTGATLTVNAAPVAPVISLQPVNQSVVSPAAATFKVVATGSPTPTYQWQLSTDGGVTFTNINGATTASYTTPATLVADGGKQFRVAATNSAGTATSHAVSLTVVIASNPTIGGFPDGVAIGTDGKLYVSVISLNLSSPFSGIRQIDANGSVTTLAGGSTEGLVDGTGAAAKFHSPAGIALDSSGNLFVADTGNHAIRSVSSAGVVTTLAGSGLSGFADGTGAAARFNRPQGLAVGANGNIYVADTGNHAIRVITPGGVVTTLAGRPSSGFVNGPVASAKFSTPQGIAVDTSGSVFVADTNNDAIRVISVAGIVSTLAGGTSGFVDGTGTTASFKGPQSLVLDGNGNVLVSDGFNYVIRRISPASVVTTWVGNGSPGFVNGTGAAARFNYPRGLVLDSSGNLFVGDILNQAVRRITPAGVTTTYAN